MAVLVIAANTAIGNNANAKALTIEPRLASSRIVVKLLFIISIGPNTAHLTR
jgi:hypothetical protein